MASEFIPASGGFTFNGTGFTTQGASHMYYDFYWRNNSISKNSHSVEWSATGLEVGDYDLAYWWGVNIGGYNKLNIRDGSSGNEHDIVFIRTSSRIINLDINDASYNYNNGEYWRLFALGVRCETGTLHFKLEPEPRTYTGTSWEVPWVAIKKRSLPMDSVPDTDPEHTPISTKSKPHPLYSN